MHNKQFALHVAIALWVAISLSGCFRKDFYPSYVTNLVQPSLIILTKDKGGEAVEAGHRFALIRDGEGAISTLNFGFSGYNISLSPSSEALTNYQKISGDDSYNVSKHRDDKHVVYGCMATMVSATITSDRDFNKDYPAGKDLSPIVSFSFESYAQFIANKYKGAPIKTISVRADRIGTIQSLRPYNPQKWAIRFDTYPDIPKGTSLHITIKITMSDELVVERTFDVEIAN